MITPTCGHSRAASAHHAASATPPACSGTRQSASHAPVPGLPQPTHAYQPHAPDNSPTQNRPSPRSLPDRDRRTPQVPNHEPGPEQETPRFRYPPCSPTLGQTAGLTSCAAGSQPPSRGPGRPELPHRQHSSGLRPPGVTASRARVVRSPTPTSGGHRAGPIEGEPRSFAPPAAAAPARRQPDPSSLPPPTHPVPRPGTVTDPSLTPLLCNGLRPVATGEQTPDAPRERCAQPLLAPGRCGSSGPA